MFNPSSVMAALIAAPVRAGEVVWIGARPGRREEMTPLTSAELIIDKGLAGDRYKGRPNGGRQLTLIGEEDLAAIASYLGRAETAPQLLRRNVVVRGLNLRALKGRRIRIGDAVIEYSGECHPCSRLEELLGVGGYNAARGHGGITARVVEGGRIALGDVVSRLGEAG